jgi:MFS family permease
MHSLTFERRRLTGYRQCIRCRPQRGPGIQRQRACATTDTVHSGSRARTTSLSVSIHPSSNVLSGSGNGNFMGSVYTATVSRNFICGTSCVPLFGRLVRGGILSCNALHLWYAPRVYTHNFSHASAGSWYRADEYGRRAGFFYVGLTLGTLTAALIQSAASSGLDGVHGLAGWRWMYIICSIITIPIGMLGVLIIPGTPERPNRWILKESDIQLSKDRLQRAGHRTEGKVTLQTFIQIAKSPRVWALLLLDIFFWNGSANTSTGGYLLWLKSLKRYSPSRLNQLGAISPALGIFYTLFVCFGSDLVFGPAWAITIAHIWNIIGLVILTVWHVPESALWFSFMTTYSAVAMSSVLYGWINSQLSYSPAERSAVLLLANAIAQSTTAWTPLLVFKTVEAPRFIKGYPFVLANAVCLIVLAHIINSFVKKDKR